jgi:hypothetical protein
MDRRSRSQLPIKAAPRPVPAPSCEEDSNTGKVKATRTDQPRVEDYVAEIEKNWHVATASIIATGRILIKARAELDHGEFGPMIKTKLPFSKRTAERLMEIARHPTISNPTHVSLLPPHWGTLYELTKIPAEELEKMLADGRINADTERQHVEEILKEIREGGLHDRENLYDAFRVLNGFRERYQEPDELSEYIVDDGIGQDLGPLTLLASWIEKLHTAVQRATKLLNEAVAEEMG